MGIGKADRLGLRFAFAATMAPVTERSQVVLFCTLDEYHHIGPQDSAGRFIHHPLDPKDTPVIAMFGDFANARLKDYLKAAWAECSRARPGAELPPACRALTENAL